MNTHSNQLTVETIPKLTLVDGSGMSDGFAKRDVDRLQTTLAHFSENMLMDEKWHLEFASSKRQISVSFPALSRKTDALLIRALILQRLSRASSSLYRAVKDAEWLFGYFDSHQLHIEHCRNATAELIFHELDNTDLSVMQKNSIMTTLDALINICRGYGFFAGEYEAEGRYRWKEHRKPKRAPDACIIEVLDSYFFDPAIEIPLQYRTAYMLLRLISNRISEVLFMPIDCITYPDIDTYSISIPTQKATPYHVPEYKQYPKKVSGIEEGYLYRCLCDLQKYAENKQDCLNVQHQGLLFVSPTGKTIVTAADMNAYFKEICEKYHIKDASGNQAFITTHDLRHVAVVERLKYGIISPHQTMRESNHSNVDQTLGYSYASVHDETEKLTKISEQVLNERSLLPTVYAEGKPRELSREKFLAFKEDFNVRLLLDGSICINNYCVPSFDTCSSCEYFHVDPVYQKPLEANIELLIEKSQALKNKSGNPETIAFIDHQVEVYTKMLNKVLGRTESEERLIV